MLIAVDGSPASLRASEVGRKLAESLGAEVAYVFVADAPAGYGLEGGVSPSEVVEAELDAGGRLVAELVEGSGLRLAPVAFVRAGNPGQEIVRVAREWNADVVVAGSRGRTGLPRLLLGSVAEHLIRNAPCPTLVVRAED